MSNVCNETGYSSIACVMPYLRLRCISSWKGFISPVSGSTATISASIMACFALTWSLTRLTASGYCSLMFSSLRLKRMIESASLWAWTRSPSYLYSAMHLPPSLSRISWGEPRRSASMGLMGSPMLTVKFFMPSNPFSATVRATLPRSLLML